MLPRWKRRKYARLAVIFILVLLFGVLLFYVFSAVFKGTGDSGLLPKIMLKFLLILFWFSLGFFSWVFFRKG